jgi:hypothetical protein
LTSTSINQPKRWFHGIIFHRNIVGFKVWTLVQTQQGSVGCWFILGGTERHVPDRIPRDPALPTYFMSFVDVDVLWHGFSIQYTNKYIYMCIYICIYICVYVQYMYNYTYFYRSHYITEKTHQIKNTWTGKLSCSWNPQAEQVPCLQMDL